MFQIKVVRLKKVYKFALQHFLKELTVFLINIENAIK